MPREPSTEPRKPLKPPKPLPAAPRWASLLEAAIVGYEIDDAVGHLVVRYLACDSPWVSS